MSVIKAGQRGAERDAQAIAFNLDDVAAQAERYLEEVRKQAAGLVREAQQEAARIRKQAAEEGRAAAEQAAVAHAEKQVTQQVATLLPALQTAVEQLQRVREHWLREWEGNVVRLAGGIARRLARRELEQDPQVSQAWIREALELAAGSSRVVLHLAPGDCATLGAQAQRLAAEIADLGGLEVAADPEIPPGECRVTTQFGEIDQRLEAQLARLSEELTY